MKKKVCFSLALSDGRRADSLECIVTHRFHLAQSHGAIQLRTYGCEPQRLGTTSLVLVA
jgi:hypothetical protein